MATDVSAFVASYVRCLARDRERSSRVMEALSNGAAFVENEFMAVVGSNLFWIPFVISTQAMIDISGYSSLTTFLDQILGKVASEAVSEAVGDYLRQVAVIVLQFGGDIVKFLGDAILVSFREVKSSDPEFIQKAVCRRALDCCLEVLQKCPNYDIDVKRWKNAIGYRRDSEHSKVDYRSGRGLDTRTSTVSKPFKEKQRLSLHIGLTMGLVSHVVAGEYTSRLDYFIQGDCFDDLHLLLDTAAPGELGVSFSAAVNTGIFGEGFADIKREGGYYVNSLKALNLPHVKGPIILEQESVESHLFMDLSVFINSSMLRRLQSDPDSDSLSEYRVISIVFAKFVDKRIRPLEIQRYLLIFLDAVRKYDGVFQQCSGDVVNLAARLLTIESEKLCVAVDERTFAAVQKYHDSIDLGMCKLKGKEEEVQVMGILPDTNRLDGGNAANSGVQELIANKDEWKLVEERCGMWISLSKRFVGLVEGMSGMGKSNFLSNLQGYLERNSIEIWIFRANEVEQNSPFYILQSILQKVNILAKSLGPLESLSQLGGKRRLSYGSLSSKSKSRLLPHHPSKNPGFEKLLELAADRPEHAFLFEEILDGWGGSSQHKTSYAVDNMDLDFKKGILKVAFVKVMHWILENRRIVILLDDIQWFDRVSLELLCDVIDITEHDNHTFKQAKCDLRLELKGMKFDETKDLMIRKCGPNFGNATFIESLLKKTGGNVLQIETLISFHADKMKKRRISDFSQSTMDSLLSFQVENVIMSKFDGLDPKFQKLLRRASILGQYFDVEDLVFLLEDRHASAASVVELIEKFDTPEFFKVEVDAMGETQKHRIFFRHITIMSAIYESISLNERQNLHLKVAARFEKLMEDGVTTKSLLPLICHHYRRTGLPKKILEKCMEMGVKLFEQKLFAESAIELQFAVQLITENAVAADALRADVKAEVFAKLSWATAGEVEFQRSIDLAVEALNLSGIDWPQNEKDLRNGILKSLVRIFKLWIYYKGGANVKSQADAAPKQLEAVDQSLSTLLAIAHINENLAFPYKILIILRKMEYALRHCHKNLSQWFQTASMAALAFSRSNATASTAKRLQRKCRAIVAKCNVDAKQSMHIYGFGLFAVLTLPRESMAACEEYMVYWTDRENHALAVSGLTSLGIAAIALGRFDTVSQRFDFDTVKTCFSQNGMWTMGSLLMVQMEMFAKGDESGFAKWRALAVELEDLATPDIMKAIGYPLGGPKLMEVVLGGGDPNLVCEAGMELAEEIILQAKDGTFSPCYSSFYIFIAITRISERRSDVDPELFEKLCGLMRQFEFIMAKLTSFTIWQFTYAMGKAGLELMESKKRTSVKLIESFLKRKAFRDRFADAGDLVMFGAMFRSILGYLLDDGDARRMHREAAGMMFGKFGALFWPKWALGKM
ncbi:hypothetical protein HDU97_007547 [Phlyctochytrium planicorne]|nr:hypothetical protein HDU97_007547 [Phlyctochytrium planicorne]